LKDKIKNYKFFDKRAKEKKVNQKQNDQIKKHYIYAIRIEGLT
jgi:hypothetical protein